MYYWTKKIDLPTFTLTHKQFCGNTSRALNLYHEGLQIHPSVTKGFTTPCEVTGEVV